MIIKRTFYFEDGLRRFFSVNKKIIIAIFLVMFAGVITGIFCTTNANVQINIYYIQNFPLRLFLLHKLSVIAYIFLEALLFFFAIILIYFLSFFNFVRFFVFFLFYFFSFFYFGRFFVFFLLAYFCYVFGVDVSVIFVVFCGIKGVFLCIFCIIPFQFSMIFIFFLFSLRQVCINKNLSACGNTLAKKFEFSVLLNYFLILSMLIIFEAILLLIITKIFVF